MFTERAQTSVTPRCACGTPRVAGVLWAFFAALMCCGVAQAADVYVSVGADGGLRYATQRVDSTYRLIFEEPKAAAPTGPALRPAGPSSAALTPPARQLRPMIERIAHRHGLSPALVEAVIAVESGHNPNAVSPKGARGAMQLMPATAANYGLVTSAQLLDPERNIDAGVRHLKDLLARHRGNVALALAAYNSGSGAVVRHGNRIPPYAETMLYVPAVMARSALLTSTQLPASQ